MSITVYSVPVANPDSYTVVAGNTLTVNAVNGVLANDTDADGGTLSAVLGTGVSHGNLTLNPDGSFTYTPAAGYSGTDSFSYAATDGHATSAPATVSITVYSVPVANPDSYTVVSGNTLTVNAVNGVLANDTDADGGTLSAVLGTGVSHGTLTLNPDGSFTYTPAAGYSGTDSFSYAATDGHATSAPATVTITIYSVPVANPDSYTVVAGNTLTVNAVNGVLANDTDADGGTLSAVLGTGVGHGNLTLNPDGSFTYTPAAGYSGTDSFSYAATDGHATSAPATVSMTVYSVPVANPDSYTVVAGNTLTVNAVNGVLANDTDADGGTLSAVLGTGVGHGTLTLNPDGSFTYTPAAGYSGTDSFTYAATDGHATSSPATVTITVATPMATIISFMPGSGTMSTVVTISGTGFTGATVVAFGGVPAAAFTVNSDTSISATVGNGSTGVITVTTPNGTATSSNTFTYLPAQLTGVTLSANLPSPQNAGTAITLTAAAQGSDITAGNVQYQFEVQYQQANGSWTAQTVLNDWSTSASCVWTATGVHKYALLVYVRPVGNAANVVTSYLTFTIQPGNLSGVTLSANPQAPQYTGTTITLTAARRGGLPIRMSSINSSPSIAMRTAPGRRIC